MLPFLFLRQNGNVAERPIENLLNLVKTQALEDYNVLPSKCLFGCCSTKHELCFDDMVSSGGEESTQ
jgi:hypothetical protein